jgi:hypothetical protein
MAAAGADLAADFFSIAFIFCISVVYQRESPAPHWGSKQRESLPHEGKENKGKGMGKSKAAKRVSRCPLASKGGRESLSGRGNASGGGRKARGRAAFKIFYPRGKTIVCKWL